MLLHLLAVLFAVLAAPLMATDDDDDPDIDLEPDDDDDPEPDEGAAVDAKALTDRIARLERALAKSNKDAERNRRRRSEAEGETAEQTLDRAERRERRAALKEALADADVPPRIARLLVAEFNLDELTFDASDRLTGHEDRLAELLDTYGDLITPPAPDTSGDDTSDDTKPAAKPAAKRRRDAAKARPAGGGADTSGDTETSAQRLARAFSGE